MIKVVSQLSSCVSSSIIACVDIFGDVEFVLDVLNSAYRSQDFVCNKLD